MSLSQAVATAPLALVEGGVELPPRQHVLDLDDFSPAEISAVLDTARGMAEVLGRRHQKGPHSQGSSGSDAVLRVQHSHQGFFRRSW